MNFRIEYNEKRGHFHLDRGTHEPGTYGWETIAEDEEDRKATIFCQLVEDNYLSGKKKLQVEEIKRLWKFYNEGFSKINKLINDSFVVKITGKLTGRDMAIQGIRTRRK